MSLIAETLDRLKILPLYIIPRHLLSRLIFHLARWERQSWKNIIIRLFIRVYHVDMASAREPDFRQYRNFNEFFARELRADVRHICEDPDSIACPIDGAVSQIGRIDDSVLFQAKGRNYDLSSLLAKDEEAIEYFRQGSYATLYLSPKDYHRIHMPVGGSLQKMTYVPGTLFAVNTPATRHIPNLFARNERIINLFDTDYGKMSLLMIGALFVGSMDTVWTGTITPAKNRELRVWDYATGKVSLDRGAELGRFNMGSSVIILFEPGRIEWLSELTAGSTVLMGQALGKRI